MSQELIRFKLAGNATKRKAPRLTGLIKRNSLKTTMKTNYTHHLSGFCFLDTTKKGILLWDIAN